MRGSPFAVVGPCTLALVLVLVTLAPTPAAAAQDCAAACQHRLECIPGVASPEQCLRDCEGLATLPGMVDTPGYVALTCDQVRAQDKGLQLAFACHAACRRRAECVPATTDVGECVGVCSGIAMVQGIDTVLQQLAAAPGETCEQYAATQATYLQYASCVKSCAHVLRCGVPGTPSDCLVACARGELGGPEQVAALPGADCAALKASVTIPTSAASGGADVGACLSQGLQTCPLSMVCCRAGRLTRRGEPGLCMYRAVCAYPWR